MNVTKENTEIRDKSHEMRAEGSSYECATISEIETVINQYGYTGNNYDSWFDTMQGFWRWSCDIKPFQST